MSLVPRYNFDDLAQSPGNFDRIFEEFPLPSWAREERLLSTPKGELTQTDEEVLLKLELPGIDPKDINIEVTLDSVSISGERKQEHREELGEMTRSEFRYGKFQRVIPLPVKIDNTNTTAEYKDGILSLKLPKAEEEKNKVVKIKLS